MKLRIEALQPDRLAEFVAYCKKHRSEIDESFLYDEDLNDFQPGPDNPAYIAVNQEGELTAAASLIVDDYNRRGRKARFRIFHSETEDMNVYKMLLAAVLKHTDGLDKLNIFVPSVNPELMRALEKLHFVVERYACLLVNGCRETAAFCLPEGYEIRPFRPESDAEIWSGIRNAGFAKLQGSETPVTPEMVQKMAAGEDYIDGGMMILYDGDKPAGIVRGSADQYEGSPIMNIGPLALLPEYQGKGLGRILLRAVLQFAKEKGYTGTILCVNAENERAKALYLQEGFEQAESAICYKFELLGV